MNDDEKVQADEEAQEITDDTEPKSEELSEEELDKVAGGIRIAVYKARTKGRRKLTPISFPTCKSGFFIHGWGIHQTSLTLPLSQRERG